MFTTQEFITQPIPISYSPGKFKFWIWQLVICLTVYNRNTFESYVKPTKPILSFPKYILIIKVRLDCQSMFRLAKYVSIDKVCLDWQSMFQLAKYVLIAKVCVDCQCMFRWPKYVSIVKWREIKWTSFPRITLFNPCLV